MIRRLLLLCVSLVCCLALTSCGGSDDEAKKDDSGIPAVARTNDEKGAQYFARYWIDNFNTATTTGDTKKLKTLQKKSCKTCTDFTKQIDDIYAAGGHVETEGLKVDKIANEANIPAPGAGVSVVLTANPQTVVPKKGAAEKTYDKTQLRLRLIMVRVQDHWEMDRIDIG